MSEEDAWEALLVAIRSAPPDRKDAVYDEHFPRIRDHVVALARPLLPADLQVPVPLLVITQGTSYPTVAYAVSLLAPRRLLVLCTAASRPYWERAREFARPPGGWGSVELEVAELDDAADPVALYAHVRDWLGRRSPAGGLADITAGTKAMSGALTLAAHRLGLRVLYWSSEEERPLYGSHPRPGSERPHVLPDPAQVFGDDLAALACRLADGGQYHGAAELLDTAAARAPGAAGIVWRIWGRLAAAYAAWDGLEVGRAERWLGEVLEEIEHHRAAIPALQPLVAQRSLLQTQRQALKALRDAQPEKGPSFLASPEALGVLAGSLLQAARRRLARGEGETAALLGYRLLELSEQAVLFSFGLDTAQPDYDRLSAAQRERIQQALGRSELPAPIGLADGFAIAAALGAPAVSRETLHKQVSHRNHGIFAHGFVPIGLRAAEGFVEFARKTAERMLEQVDVDRKVWDALAFVRFSGVEDRS